MSNLLATALFWNRAGVATIPIKYMDKKPDGRLLPDGKWEQFKTQLPTVDQLKSWFPGSLHNLGVVTGWQNILVIDFDDANSYIKWTQWATRQGGYTRRLAELTYQVRTARGVHVYVRTMQPEQNRKLEGIDIKARGGYVLAPPSIHPTNVPYTIKQQGVPMMVEGLSDVLPAQFLITHNDLPAMVKNVVNLSPRILSDDPWEMAMHSPDPSRDLVEQIRETFRVESFFPHAEATSSNRRWYMDKCPFHDDGNPSFWIDTNRQICSCYGGCTPKPLDVINLYARLHGLTNRDAIHFMAHHL